MTNSHPVLVHWSDKKLGSPPISGQYITVARFPEDDASWSSDLWSVVLKIRGDACIQPCEAEAKFLSPDAPEDRLRSGTRFEMLEGNEVTAIVDVL